MTDHGEPLTYLQPREDPEHAVYALADDGGWIMWATRESSGTFTNVGDHWYSTQYAMGDEPVYRVLVQPNEEGPHAGWTEEGTPYPVLIQPSLAILDMCFAYGVKPELARGRGPVQMLGITPYPGS